MCSTSNPGLACVPCQQHILWLSIPAGEAVHEHEELKVKHAELQRQHEAALRVANDHQHALQARQQEVERSSELVESLRKSLSQYVGACALHSSFADGNLTSAEREETGRAADAAQQRELRLLEQLDGKTAELDALRTLGPDLAAARARIAELETECDRAHAAARRSDHAAKEQEVKVNELNKRLLSQREAIGRSEMVCERNQPSPALFVCAHAYQSPWSEEGSMLKCVARRVFLPSS